MSEKTKITSSKLLPHMIKDHEVPSLMAFEESAAHSHARRQTTARERARNRSMDRWLLGSAALLAAGTLLGKEIIDYNHSHSTGNPSSQRRVSQGSSGNHNTYVSSGGTKVTLRAEK